MDIHTSMMQMWMAVFPYDLVFAVECHKEIQGTIRSLLLSAANMQHSRVVHTIGKSSQMAGGRKSPNVAKVHTVLKQNYGWNLFFLFWNTCWESPHAQWWLGEHKFGTSFIIVVL